LRILITGASGFIGAPLCSFLSRQGHEVLSLSRSCQETACISWNLEREDFVLSQFEGFDAVVHLAGDPLTIGRWSHAKQERILSSRVHSTRLLCKILASLSKRPRLFISASAVGFYGDRKDAILDEASHPGSSFLSSVCIQWEGESQLLASYGIKVAHTRFGVVLGPDGGILQRLVPLYRLYLGSTLGTGFQWMSWISLEDLIHAMHLILTKNLEGNFNFVSPYPVRQKDFSLQLASVLHTKTFLRIPAWILRGLLGVCAQEMLLTSTRVVPKRLLEMGFLFKYPLLKEALSYSLKNL
jgi:uncharacterized protein (TIGR01777 family)